FIPSMAVILSAFADILMTLAVVDLFGLKMSTAGIVAFLMLIGYSVDTDILLTIRVLKRDEDPLNTRLLGALKTGLTMTLTSFFAILAALFIVQSFSVVLTQIFIILVLGLFFDMLNTWITNVSILKWYAEHKENKK
ncbi:preprotein translocase subunit SecF, partial [Candidatus Pacearchaeota archaeon CG09_land_8_20_14_0_10_30_9]